MKKKVYIATHGEMAEGIKNSLELIAGDSAKEIEAYSLIPGKNPQDFIRQIEEDIQEDSETQYIILGDLYGASIVNSMVQLAGYENVVLLSGVNLSMALQVLLSVSESLTDSEVEMIIAESKMGIQRIVLPKEINENNEF
ncbi:PTS sugar transporter subunit IIA [Enterococcus sp. AZ103]|uniref:PTS sugar transporter subunit IIA n=1 Tax=Enterococcus sp. AZ103 TaxID=2774628 RepID=UPI003F29E768